jgi:hypothetical protein
MSNSGENNVVGSKQLKGVNSRVGWLSITSPHPGPNGRRPLEIAGIRAEELRLYGVGDEDSHYLGVRLVQAACRAPFGERELARSRSVRFSRLVWARGAAFQIVDQSVGMIMHRTLHNVCQNHAGIPGCLHCLPDAMSIFLS